MSAAARQDAAPERLDRFMARANARYYARHDPFADFTTSPEISQIFGELLGAWAAIAWEAIGRPSPVILAEAGPGRGSLMADALRVIARLAPDFHAALSVHLIETSPRLRAEQAKRLPAPIFHDDLGSLPEGPLLLLANEFLDALPIRQFRRTAGGWTERHVAAGAPIDLPCPDPAGGEHLDVGAVLERNEPAEDFTRRLAARLASQSGVALLIDYGRDGNPGDSLQALRDGRPADPYGDPGEADLTAHVDFAAMARVARAAGAAVQGPATQGAFLGALGLPARTERLAAGKPADAAKAIRAGARRLIEPLGMGGLFLALAITGPATPPLPGFAP